MRLALAALLVAVALAAFCGLTSPSATERAAWLADLDRLERHTARAYANLGDRLASRRLSPRELDHAAREALASARTRSQARAALAHFVAAFDDGHFQIHAPDGPVRRLLRRLVGQDGARDEATLPRSATGEQACERLGTRDRRQGPLAWEALPGFEPLDRDAATHPFPAGLLSRQGRPPLAVLRIGLFSESAFPQLCAAEWERFRGGLPAGIVDCDEDCRDRFASTLERALLERFAAQLAEMAAAGASALLVDLTDNGGGSGIVGPMARMVTTRPLRERPFGFIRHPHSVARLQQTVDDLRRDLARPGLSTRQREILTTAIRRAEAAVREAATPCDLSTLWQLDAGAPLPCENIGRSAPLADDATTAELADLESRGVLGAGGLSFREGVWSGELFVLTNHRTASASEDFAASLQDAGAARILGERTLGVGCGYTNGGVTLELPGTGMTVRAPDCVRFRADGRNEADGVAPDLQVTWSGSDSARERAARAVAALPF